MASSSRKNTVRRERSRSSSTISRTGCVATKGLLTGLASVPYAPRNDSFRPHRVGLAPRAERERRLLT
jgi:hypothetical protein